MAAGTKFSRLGSPLDDLRRAAAERAKDATALLAAGRFATAVAYGIYSLEIELKVVICHRLDLEGLPRAFETHDLEDLLLLSGVSRLLGRVKRPRQLKKSWDNLIDEVSKLPRVDELRYGFRTEWNEEWANKIFLSLTHPTSGVIPWLQKQAPKLSRSRSLKGSTRLPEDGD